MADNTREELLAKFGANFLDGDKVVDWKASTINATVIVEYIDDFVLPLIQSEITKAYQKGKQDGIVEYARSLKETQEKMHNEAKRKEIKQ